MDDYTPDAVRDELRKLRSSLEGKRDYIVFLHEFYIDWATESELWEDFERYLNEGMPEDFKPKYNL